MGGCQSCSRQCPIAYWSLGGTLIHWVNDSNSFRTLMPGSNWYIELWALFVYFRLFHKFLALLIKIYLLVSCLLTQSPQICLLVISAGSVSLPKKNHIFCSFGDFIEPTLFMILSKLLDKTNPNVRDGGILLLTLPPQAAVSISCIYSLFLSLSQIFLMIKYSCQSHSNTVRRRNYSHYIIIGMFLFLLFLKVILQKLSSFFPPVIYTLFSGWYF